MRRSTIFRVIFALGAAILSGNAAAVGIGVGYFNTGGFYLDGTNVLATFRVNDKIVLEPYAQYETSDDADSNGTTSTTISGYGLGILSPLEKRDNLTMYVGVRIADSTLTQESSSGSLGKLTIDVLSIIPLGGVDYALSANFSAGFEIGYSFDEGKNTYDRSSSNNSDISGGGVFSSLIMRYHFSSGN